MGLPTPRIDWLHKYFIFFKTKIEMKLNNIKTTATFILVATISLFLNSCKDEHDDHAKPTIAIQSPAQGVQLNESDTLWIRVNISSEDDIHDYSIEVTKVLDGSSVYKYNGHSHNTSVNTNLYFMPDVTANTEMKLTVKTLDHNGDTYEQSVTFTVVDNVQPSKAEITILSPNSSMATNGQPLNIKGNINHDKNIKSARILLTENEVTVFDYIKTNINMSTYAFDTSYLINTTTHSDYVLTISATDINDVQSSKTFNFHVHP